VLKIISFLKLQYWGNYMAHESGKCKVKGCNRGQQPGTGGYCSRCFKVITEKQNARTLETMSQLLVKVGSQLSELSQRVEHLEIPITKGETEQKPIQGQKSVKKSQHVLVDEPEEMFIPSLDAPKTDISSIVTKVDIKKGKNMNLAVKKLKIIQDTNEKIT